MFTNKLILAASVSVIIASQPAIAVIGPIKITLNPTELSSNYFNEIDIKAPFSSEVYTEADIKASKSTNVYDFLTQNTSLALAPSSGNRFSQSISARGFGLTDGYQNIVVTLNGRRLNNIDMTNSNLGGINIDSIEKIEIAMGSGSVVYGDNATAGAVHIFTKTNEGFNTSTSFGNYGHQKRTLSYGISDDTFNFNILIDRLDHGGYGSPDSIGNKDKGSQANANTSLGFRLENGANIQFDRLNYKVNNKYPYSLSKTQFDLNPSNDSSSKARTHKDADSTTTGLKVTFPLSNNLEVNFDTFKTQSIDIQ